MRSCAVWPWYLFLAFGVHMPSADLCMQYARVHARTGSECSCTGECCSWAHEAGPEVRFRGSEKAAEHRGIRSLVADIFAGIRDSPPAHVLHTAVKRFLCDTSTHYLLRWVLLISELAEVLSDSKWRTPKQVTNRVL